MTWTRGEMCFLAHRSARSSNCWTLGLKKSKFREASGAWTEKQWMSTEMFCYTNLMLEDMIGSSRDGYYPCLQLEHFHDRTIVVNEPSLDVSLAAGACAGLDDCKTRHGKWFWSSFPNASHSNFPWDWQRPKKPIVPTFRLVWTPQERGYDRADFKNWLFRRGPVRTAKLRVDQQAGAGLQLSACEARRTLNFCRARSVCGFMPSWKFTTLLRFPGWVFGGGARRVARSARDPCGWCDRRHRWGAWSTEEHTRIWEWHQWNQKTHALCYCRKVRALDGSCQGFDQENDENTPSHVAIRMIRQQIGISILCGCNFQSLQIHDENRWNLSEPQNLRIFIQELLIGLSEAKIEEEFGKNFENGPTPRATCSKCHLSLAKKVIFL